MSPSCQTVFPSIPGLADNAYGNCFSCLAQLSGYKEEGVIRRTVLNQGTERTAEALTAKEKVKSESHKERKQQMDVASGELCQYNISFLHIFF